MPRVGITEYDLLISCPGDVNGFIDIIRECIDNFNRVLGSVNKVGIVARHWSTDSYPQSGDRPQELLNQQFVRECDAAVALFWTKFGTPTDKYGSGTEEEVEEMLASGKQVFMYFLDVPVNLSNIDMDQYKKVEDFKAKYKGRGIYALVKDEHELRQQFTNHLAMYFLPLIMKDKGNYISVEKKAVPILKVKGVDSESESEAILQNTAFSQSELIRDKVQNIVDMIISLQEEYLPERREPEDEKDGESLIVDGQTAFSQIMKDKIFPLGDVIDADIPDTWKNKIAEFAYKNGLELEKQFWNVGNLKKSEAVLATWWGNGLTLEGTDKEKERYRSMEKLYWNILGYEEYLAYFTLIDQCGYVELMVMNVGSTFDEDVDVKVSIKKKCVCKEKEIAVPGRRIIGDILKTGFCEYVFQIKCDDTLDKYSGYPVKIPSFVPADIPMPFNGKSATEEYNDNKKKYYDELENIFCYEYYEKGNQDILIFHINYLKHNTAMAFPSVLFFNNVPDAIDYEISSKHIPDIIRGTIKIIK